MIRAPCLLISLVPLRCSPCGRATSESSWSFLLAAGCLEEARTEIRQGLLRRPNGTHAATGLRSYAWRLRFSGCRTRLARTSALEASEDPALDDLHGDFDFRFIPRMRWPGGQDHRAVMLGELLVGALQPGLVA